MACSPTSSRVARSEPITDAADAARTPPRLMRVPCHRDNPKKIIFDYDVHSRALEPKYPDRMAAIRIIDSTVRKPGVTSLAMERRPLDRMVGRLSGRMLMVLREAAWRLSMATDARLNRSSSISAGSPITDRKRSSAAPSRAGPHSDHVRSDVLSVQTVARHLASWNMGDSMIASSNCAPHGLRYRYDR